MYSIERNGDVYVLDLGEGDHRFNEDTVAALNDRLDEIETASPCALVVTATGKVWHNGLDLEAVMAMGDGALAFVDRVEALFGRFMRLPLPTVAAIQGHCFAAGAMLALAFDVRIMRSDRGFFCLPEVDLRLPFGDGMSALIRAKLPQPALHRAAVLGERFGGPDAASAGIVAAAVPLDDVRSVALERACELAPKADANLAVLRDNLYGPAIAALE